MAETQSLPADLVEIAYGTILFSTGLGLVVLGLLFRSARSYEVPAFGTAILLHGTRALDWTARARPIGILDDLTLVAIDVP